MEDLIDKQYGDLNRMENTERPNGWRILLKTKEWRIKVDLKDKGYREI